MLSFEHGWQSCRACHVNGQDLRVEGAWHLRANPGYWGSSTPKVLVLGFSKGANQMKARQSGNFDGVAFAGMRPRLQQILDVLGIDLEGQTIDEALTVRGRVLGAASLIRCGLSVEKNGKLVTSGTIMTQAMRDPFPRGVMATCIARHLGNLPESVTTVVLLGTTDAYIDGVKTLMREHFPDYADINRVAFSAQGRVWVFAAHPSPANGEFKRWLTGDAASTSGRKRMLALIALGSRNVARPATGNRAQPSHAPTPLRTPEPHRARTRSASSADRFAKTFHLVRSDGRKFVPVMMKNRATGKVAFRVSAHGNTNSDALEVTDEAKLLAYCESGQYRVRVQPPDKSAPPSLLHPLLKHRIVRSPA